jgi:hypothetical protein
MCRLNKVSIFYIITFTTTIDNKVTTETKKKLTYIRFFIYFLTLFFLMQKVKHTHTGLLLFNFNLDFNLILNLH